MSLRRAWGTWLAALVLIPPTLFVAACFGLYAYSARLAPATLHASAEPAPAEIRRQFLIVETGGATSMAKENPVSFWLHAVQDMRRTPRTRSPERRLLLQAASSAQRTYSRARSQRERHLSSIAITVKIGRQWTFEQAVDTILAESQYGKGVTGLRQASTYYFGTTPDALRPQESLALIVLSRGPSWYDVYCKRERFDERYVLSAQQIGEVGAEWSVDAALKRLRPRECKKR